MPPDDTIPATKADIRLLMEEMARLYDANQRWKDEILEHVAAAEIRTKEHFDVVAENLRHDYAGAFEDKLGQHTDTIERHEDRLLRLERRAGLPAA